MNSKTILVALNLAHERHPAFERALALAEASDAELYVFHAVPADRSFAFRAAERLRSSSTLRERAAAAGVEMQVVEQHGDPAELIALHADARGADLIVMGTERRSGWARLRRSVVERVLRRTNRPVLAIPREDSGHGSAFQRVLVAADLSPASAPLIATSLQLFGRRPGQLTVMHGIEGLEPHDTFLSRARWMVPEYRRHVVSDARADLAAAMPPRIPAGADVRIRVATGPAGQAIEATAAEVDADLVVMGGSRRFMHVGSTAARVLRTTERPLLIVPEAAAASMARRGEPVHTRAA